VLQLEQSGMLMAPVPAAADLPNLTTQVAANNGWSIASYAEDERTMGFLRSRIKHVIYVVKENRTYDPGLSHQRFCRVERPAGRDKLLHPA